MLGLLGEPEFATAPSAGVVVQAYLRDPASRSSGSSPGPANAPAAPLVVRLVKGAYWDHEVIEAGQHGWPAPVHDDKAACDRSFEALTLRLLEARPHVRVAIASHNLRSVAHAIARNRRQERRTATSSSRSCAAWATTLHTHWPRRGAGARVLPGRRPVAGMAYLVRRLLENTANESFLAERAHGTALDELLAAP